MKMAGTGNDFIVFDNRKRLFSGAEKSFFASICRRRVSVGADGVILVEKGTKTPVRMRYFNSDGGEVAVCGNGARCIGYYALKKGFVDKNVFSLEASDGIHRVKVEKNNVTLEMTRPTCYRSDVDILRETEFKEGGFIDTGVPHYVIFVPELEDVNVEEIGSYYRNHSVFSEGANVNFVQLMEKNQIRVRTYERGVEGETLSCGTGCVAATLLAEKKYNFISPVTVLTRGGELTVRFDENWEEVTLKGRVEIVYTGILFLSSLKTKK